MSTSDFSLSATQELLKWILGKPATPFVQPLHVRILAAANATPSTPGTEVAAGAAGRVGIDYAPAYIASTNLDENRAGIHTVISEAQNPGKLIWTGPDITAVGTEIWDNSSPPKRLCYQQEWTDFSVSTGDSLEWQNSVSALSLSSYFIDSTVLAQALDCITGKSTDWAQPVAPFKIKLVQLSDSQNIPKSTLETTPMQTISFGPVSSDSNNQAYAVNDINVSFPVISTTNHAIVHAYELWDSSPTPRRIIYRTWNLDQDLVEEDQTPNFVSIPPGNSLTIPKGSMKIALGKGDN